MTAAEYAAGLREAAEWIEANEAFVDDHIGLEGTLTLLDYCMDPDELAEHVRVLGSGEKGCDDNYFNVTRRCGPILIQVYTTRETVCRKVTRTEWREVEVTEWECAPILAGASAEGGGVDVA